MGYLYPTGVANGVIEQVELIGSRDQAANEV
jgi:hypothetical protein